MNPLQSIPPTVRRYLYFAYALAGLVLACLAVYDVPTAKPAAVLVIVGTAFGFTAGSNVRAGERRRGREDAA